MIELLKKRTPAERLAMGCSMFDTARALMRAGIKTQSPHISTAELRIQMLRRTYGFELSESRMNAIERRIGAGSRQEQAR